MKSKRIWFLPGCVLPLLLAAAVLGEELKLPAPGMPGWQTLDFPRIEKHTRYAMVTEDGMSAVQAVANCSASALYLPIDVDLAKTPWLQWKWKVEQPLPPHNEQEKAGDDFAARVYVMFAFDAARASWWQRLRHRMGKMIYGETIPGAAINYVFSTSAPAGETWDSPFAAESKMVSLGTGPVGKWLDESANVASDYRRYFGASPPRVLGVAIMTDSDNSCKRAVAYYADVRFAGKD